MINIEETFSTDDGEKFDNFGDALHHDVLCKVIDYLHKDAECRNEGEEMYWAEWMLGHSEELVGILALSGITKKKKGGFGKYDSSRDASDPQDKN